MKHHGDIVRERFEQLGVSQAKVADKLGMSRQNMSNVLKRPSIHSDILKRLGDALEVDFFKLIYDEDEREFNTMEESNLNQEEYILRGRIIQLEIMLEKKESKNMEEALLEVLNKEMKLYYIKVDEMHSEINLLNDFIHDKFNWRSGQKRDKD